VSGLRLFSCGRTGGNRAKAATSQVQDNQGGHGTLHAANAAAGEAGVVHDYTHFIHPFVFLVF
jgi:hypothetical protein